MSHPTFNADSVPDTTHHHVHADNEPLPTHAERATDYSTQALEGTGTALPEKRTGPVGVVEKGLETAKGKHQDTSRPEQEGFGTMESDKHHRTGLERSDVPPPAVPGTVGAIDTRTGADHTHDNAGKKVSIGDKVIGKAQQVVGKVAKKPEMQEKGELRKTEGITSATRDA